MKINSVEQDFHQLNKRPCRSPAEGANSSSSTTKTKTRTPKPSAPADKTPQHPVQPCKWTHSAEVINSMGRIGQPAGNQREGEPKWELLEMVRKVTASNSKLGIYLETVFQAHEWAQHLEFPTSSKAGLKESYKNLGWAPILAYPGDHDTESLFWCTPLASTMPTPVTLLHLPFVRTFHLLSNSCEVAQLGHLLLGVEDFVDPPP